MQATKRSADRMARFLYLTLVAASMSAVVVSVVAMNRADDAKSAANAAKAAAFSTAHPTDGIPVFPASGGAAPSTSRLVSPPADGVLNPMTDAQAMGEHVLYNKDGDLFWVDAASFQRSAANGGPRDTLQTLADGPQNLPFEGAALRHSAGQNLWAKAVPDGTAAGQVLTWDGAAYSFQSLPPQPPIKTAPDYPAGGEADEYVLTWSTVTGDIEWAPPCCCHKKMNDACPFSRSTCGWPTCPGPF